MKLKIINNLIIVIKIKNIYNNNKKITKNYNLNQMFNNSKTQTIKKRKN